MNHHARRKSQPTSSLHALTAELVAAGRAFYSHRWVLGTSGNFSAVLAHDPWRLIITASGLDKSALTSRDFLEIDEHGKVIRGSGRPSSEAPLHLTVARVRRAGVVLHTHSVWSTVLSDVFARQGGIEICGYEMLKGLEGVTTYEYREWLPILDNSPNLFALAEVVEQTLQRYPDSHGFVLRRHGLYTWGRDVAGARRHVEILEFLLEVLGRRRAADNMLPRVGGANRS